MKTARATIAAIALVLLPAGCQVPTATPKPETAKPTYRIFVPDGSLNGPDPSGTLMGFYWSQEAAVSVLARHPQGSCVVRVIQPEE